MWITTRQAVWFENADDHKYIQTVAVKHGGPETWATAFATRFIMRDLAFRATLIGSDSHTPGLGMLAMGAGGMDVAVVTGGGATIPMPRMIFVN